MKNRKRHAPSHIEPVHALSTIRQRIKSGNISTQKIEISTLALLFLGFFGLRFYPVVLRGATLGDMPLLLVTLSFFLATGYATLCIYFTESSFSNRLTSTFAWIAISGISFIAIGGCLQLTNGIFDFGPTETHEVRLINQFMHVSRGSEERFMEARDWRAPSRDVSFQVDAKAFLGGLNAIPMQTTVQIETSRGFLGFERVIAAK